MRTFIVYNLFASLYLRVFRLFSGTLVHGFVRFLKGGQDVECLLGGAPSIRRLFFSLLDAVRNCSGKIHPASSARGGKKRGRGQGRRGRGVGGRGARGGPEELNRFALLMSEEESDEDDY